MKVALIDHGAGNVASVERALQKLGAEPLRANTPECLATAETLWERLLEMEHQCRFGGLAYPEGMCSFPFTHGPRLFPWR